MPTKILLFTGKKTIYIKIIKHYKTVPGNYCEGATPDPIPNSEVKSFSANGTLS